MALVSILGTDIVRDSRAVINSNFTFLESEIATKVDIVDFDTLETLVNTKANDNVVVKLTGDQTIAGIKTFSSFPITPSSAPTTDYQTANKKYVDDTSFAGVSNASETVRGIVEEATDAEVTAGTAVGATGAKLFVTPAKLATSRIKPSVRAYLTSDLTLGTALVKLPFGTEELDATNNFSGGTFTAPTAGNYFVSAKVVLNNASGNSPQQTSIYKNGASYSTLIFRSSAVSISGSQQGTGHVISELIPLAASDTIEIYARTPDTGATSAGSGSQNTSVSIFKV